MAVVKLVCVTEVENQTQRFGELTGYRHSLTAAAAVLLRHEPEADPL
jgi:hypothetical protein